MENNLKQSAKEYASMGSLFIRETKERAFRAGWAKCVDFILGQKLASLAARVAST